jgi:hypothetical protein
MEPIMNTDANRFSNLYALFNFAVSQKLKYPKIRLQHGNDVVVVKLAGSMSRYQGQLMVTNDAGYGATNNKYFGRVDHNGAIIAGRDLTPEVESLLEEFATNPVEVAQRYGKLTGNCMFCSKPLTDADSTACGYGPVCAKKWNLPHSAAKQSRQSRKRPYSYPSSNLNGKEIIREKPVYDGTEDYQERVTRENEQDRAPFDSQISLEVD